MDMHAVAAKVQTLVVLRHFVAAFDIAHVVSKPTRLCITIGAIMDASTRETLFFVQHKQYSLHRERTLLDARNMLPVATLRLGLFKRARTYSVYVRTEHEETPCSFKYTVDGTTVHSEFTDLVSSQQCTIGCDGFREDSNTVNFWLTRGSSETADALPQTIARLTYKARDPKTKDEQHLLLDLPAGVDQMMMVLICIGLLDKCSEGNHSSQ